MKEDDVIEITSTKASSQIESNVNFPSMPNLERILPHKPHPHIAQKPQPQKVYIPKPQQQLCNSQLHQLHSHRHQQTHHPQSQQLPSTHPEQTVDFHLNTDHSSISNNSSYQQANDALSDFSPKNDYSTFLNWYKPNQQNNLSKTDFNINGFHIF
jgi:hypothetical protein